MRHSRIAIGLCSLVVLLGPLPGPTASHGGGVSSTGIPEPFPQPLLQECLGLWAASGYGFSLTERAAWILDEGGGTYRLWWWPWSAETRLAAWGGLPIPGRAVGILHTHPNQLSPKPSMKAPPSDRHTSTSLRLPVYVLHRRGIWKIEPDARHPFRIADGRWHKSLPRSR
jgi:hypothetical protein